jgi:cytochrome b involved in lipid metabolism
MISVTRLRTQFATGIIQRCPPRSFCLEQIKALRLSHQQFNHYHMMRRSQSNDVVSNFVVPLAALNSCTNVLEYHETKLHHRQSGNGMPMMMMMMASGITAFCFATTTVFDSPNTTICDDSSTVAGKATTATDDSTKSSIVLTPSVVAEENLEDVQQSNDADHMPIYSLDELAENNGDSGKPIWMSYGGIIYDVTNFVKNHPGGSEKIMMAAGSHIEPFWYLYRQHYSSDLPMRLMEHMAIGRLSETDQDMINEQLEILEQNDPYSKEPLRHKSLIIHGDTPMNAEIPSNLLLNEYITPTSLFYIRHHHPVPYLTDKDIQNFRLHIDLSCFGGPKDFQYTLDELKQMEPTSVTVTLQCSGNRRSGFNFYQRTSGTPWGKFKHTKIT